MMNKKYVNDYHVTVCNEKYDKHELAYSSKGLWFPMSIPLRQYTEGEGLKVSHVHARHGSVHFPPGASFTDIG